MQILRKVPTQIELTVPQELRRKCQRQVLILSSLHIALLQFVVVARYLGVEAHVLRQPVESESAWQVEPLRFRLDLLERFERFVHRTPLIVHSTTPIVLTFINRSLARSVAVAMRVGEREVGRVVRHRMALSLYAHPHVRQREIGLRNLGHGYALYGVALVLVGSGIESLVEQHVVVERIVLGRRLLLSHRVVERSRHLSLVGEELAKLYVCRNRIVGIVVGGALCHTVLQSAKASRSIASLHIDIAKVGQLHVEVALRSPASRTVVVLKAQLVDPHLATLGTCRIVAHTDYHRLHVAKRRVAHDGDAILRIVGVVSRVRTIVRRLSYCLRLVALALQSG